MESLKQTKSLDPAIANEDKILLSAIASSLQGIPSFISEEEIKTPDASQGIHKMIRRTSSFASMVDGEIGS